MNRINKWCRNGVREEINEVPVCGDRAKSGGKPSPSAGVIDSQSVKTTEGRKGLRASVRDKREHLADCDDVFVAEASI